MKGKDSIAGDGMSRLEQQGSEAEELRLCHLYA
jgi:hypothetical protein